MKTITFNELRRIKDALPHGSTLRIAEELNIPVETVRNYFGGITHSVGSNNSSIHIEPGPEGGIVVLEDPAILEKALIILGETTHKVASL
ncbi:MAG: DNA-binding protein [Dysgonamonadaceae bacterium]|jgi:hypothetical protein|nr:DNA-binding protein [Dysgonamonadaceae bacterium]